MLFKSSIDFYNGNVDANVSLQKVAGRKFPCPY